MVITNHLLELFLETRKHTETICESLQTEDYVVQPIPDVSPPKWHLGHTTWFFEEFILKPHAIGYQVFNDDFSFVFNSYYESVGKRVVRANRGNLSRPSVKEIYNYRTYVTEKLTAFCLEETNDEILSLLEVGIHHEKQQHQELLLTDIKYILGNNPLLPIYSSSIAEHKPETAPTIWLKIPEGVYKIGHKGNEFCYDNELGRHQVYLNAFEIATTLVTNKDYLEFITDGGYQKHHLWHAEGWDWVNTQNITAPLYWHNVDNQWHNYTLNGLQKLNLQAPVTHISYYEAYAFAQWKRMRLPTEFEWEIAQKHFKWGLRWEWTESAYLPYPNYKKADGALGEYNGKFMVNQKVLRGGSIATPKVIQDQHIAIFFTHNFVGSILASDLLNNTLCNN